MSDKKQDTVRLNVDDYDFQGLTADVLELANLPSAIATVAKRAVVVPLIVGIVAFFVFNSRTGTFASILIALVAMVLSVGAGLAIGVWGLTRKRGKECVAATDRVVSTLGDVHKDLGDLPINQTKPALGGLAADYLNSGAIEEMAVGFVPGFIKPLAKPIAKRVVWGPKRIIAKSTQSIIDELPTEALEKSLDEGGAIDKISGLWEGAADGVETTVNKVLKLTMVPLAIGVLIALIPLAIWVALMFLAT